MAARAPDGAGDWMSADGRVALAHRRLAIIDTSERGAQPMASGDGRLTISFNGEIYNYRELRIELERDGHVFRTGSDTEVLLHLYQRDGEAMLGKLRGIFAFALWDADKHALFLARDPFGHKPLYFADDGRTVRAASLVKALLRAKVDASPEPAGHAGFWLWGTVPEPWTLHRGIRAVPAGHFLWVRDGRCESPRSYCSIPEILAAAAQAPAKGTRKDALDAVRAAVRDSVAAHLVSDVPVSVFLSSGLDSGMICSQVREAGVRPHTLTLGFSEYVGTTHDEVPLAEQIARELDADHETVAVLRRDFERDRVRLLEAMDQPSIDGVNTWFVARAAASRGIKVALSGLGGDELFASYPSFRQVPMLARAVRPFAAIPGLAKAWRHATAPLFLHTSKPKLAGVLEYGGSLAGAYLLRRGLFMPWELPALLGDDMAREGWDTLQTLPMLRACVASPSNEAGRRLSLSALEMSWYMRNQLLRDADWAGMSHSVEIRTPLADVRLLRELAPWFAAHPDITKTDVAEAIAPSLHDAWLKRPKTGFTVPVRQWLGGTQVHGARDMRGWALYVDQAFGLSRDEKRASKGNGLRVLLLATDAYGGHGGIAFHNRRLIDAIAEMPEVAEVVVLPRVMRFTPTGIPSKVRFLTHAAGSKARYVAALLPLMREHFDLVICGHVNLLSVAAPFAKVKSASLVLEVYGIEIWNGARPMPARWLGAVDAIWSVSRVTADRMNAWAHLPEDRYTVLPSTFHPDQFGPAPKDTALMERYGLAGSKVIMTLARLAGFERYKGVDEILECLPDLLAREPDLKYLVVGDGDDQKRLEAKAQALGLGSRVVFTGFVPDTEKADHLRLADVFALPGRGEGFGIVFLEALACGVPVVGSMLDGSREALLNGELGELANPDSRASIVECVLRALAKPREVPPALASFGWPAFRKRVADNVRSATERRADAAARHTEAASGRSLH